MTKVLLVEDKESLGRMLQETLAAEGLDCELAGSGEEAVRKITGGARYSSVVTDLRLPGKDGIEVLKVVRETDPDCPVIVMTAYGTIEDAVSAMKLGAFDFIQKPLDTDHLLLLLRRSAEARQLRVENLLLKEEFQRRHGIPAIVADSARMKALSLQLQKVAGTDATVLLQGESGTGKELFARAIHQLSPRHGGPFVAVNSAAIPETLLENELFGHERGAFTGASGRQIGRFELADGGSIFLDEIAELGMAMQAKILRVIQERRFERVGGSVTLDADVRIVCATNRDLAVEVREGRFREDLFFRINVFPIVIPPLRARRDDIDPLVEFFLGRFSREVGRSRVTMTDQAREKLRAYQWPGNIRELENCIERAVILCEDGRIDVADLQLGMPASRGEIADAVDLSGTLADGVARATASAEESMIREALGSTDSRADAAVRLGISTRLLSTKIREHRLDDGEENDRE
jgi:DNA-binding NtrC family response regulator